MTSSAAPTFVTIRDSLDAVRLALVGLGAVAQSHRSVALDLDDELVLLSYDQESSCTVLAVGGTDSLATATWLSHQLEDAGCRVDSLLPPVAPAS